MIKKHTISRDDAKYDAFPDVVLAASGKLVCVFAECTHHGDHSHTCGEAPRGPIRRLALQMDDFMLERS